MALGPLVRDAECKGDGGPPLFTLCSGRWVVGGVASNRWGVGGVAVMGDGTVGDATLSRGAWLKNPWCMWIKVELVIAKW